MLRVVVRVYLDRFSQLFFCSLFISQYIDGILDWRRIQILARSMPSLHKTLIVASLRKVDEPTTLVDTHQTSCYYEIDELAMGTEHAPFRHKKQKIIQAPGEQRKKNQQKPLDETTPATG
jgi:hypothetical protein